MCVHERVRIDMRACVCVRVTVYGRTEHMIHMGTLGSVV